MKDGKKIVITYGTYDLLHYGHIALLKRAKALGDYLIVGVTNDNFDRERGKLNVRNNVLERVEAVRKSGLADEIVIENYIGQKIDDIQKYDVDIFAIGSDWKGQFDYLNEYCKVVYLPRTEGISSTQLRAESAKLVTIGIVGCGRIASRFINEMSAVSGCETSSVYDIDAKRAAMFAYEHSITSVSKSIDDLLSISDAIYIATPHLTHEGYIRTALESHKHVLCETPMALNGEKATALYDMAKRNNIILLEANKTAFCPAFNHLVVLVKSGLIGQVVDVDASLSKLWVDKGDLREFDPVQAGGSMFELASYPLLPIFRFLGTDIIDFKFLSQKNEKGIDLFTRGLIFTSSGVGSFKVGLGVKTEGSLIISGTKGYAYVPAPWWKTDYFELRFEDTTKNKKFFYQWDGDGLRYEIQEFVSSIVNKRLMSSHMPIHESVAMATVMEKYKTSKNIVLI